MVKISKINTWQTIIHQYYIKAKSWVIYISKHNVQIQVISEQTSGQLKVQFTNRFMDVIQMRMIYKQNWLTEKMSLVVIVMLPLL
jgi:hypothetical protein